MNDIEMVYNVCYTDEDDNEQFIDTMTEESLEELRTKFDCEWMDEDGNSYAD